MGPTWVLSAPDGPHVGPMNLAIRENHCWPDVCIIVSIWSFSKPLNQWQHSYCLKAALPLAEKQSNWNSNMGPCLDKHMPENVWRHNDSNCDRIDTNIYDRPLVLIWELYRPTYTRFWQIANLSTLGSACYQGWGLLELHLLISLLFIYLIL